MEGLTESEIAGFAVGALLLGASIAAQRVDGFITTSQRRSLNMCKRCGDLRMVACSTCKGVGSVRKGGTFTFGMLEDIYESLGAETNAADLVACSKCRSKGRLLCPECSKQGSTDAKNGHCLVAREAVCKAKVYGGLSLHNLKLMNTALRARWCWLPCTVDDRSWSDVDVSVSKKTEELYCTATECIVGSGNKISFWKDGWNGGCAAGILQPDLMQFVHKKALSRYIAEALHDNRWT